MQIQWLGLGAFKIQTTQATIITDPFTDTKQLALPKFKAELVLVSDTGNPQANNVKRLSGEPFVVTGPGEYEIHDVFVYGVPAEHTVYVIEVEGMNVAFLGTGKTAITTKQLESIEGADILLLPLDNFSKEQRTTLISEIEPRIIVPYLYNAETLAAFLKEMGVKNAEAKDKLVVKAKDLPNEDTMIELLKPN
ncbi:MAG: MBL fold metallo-hydrolase [Patescibacteria group bacterium]|jgi:L-ascorbate metabolism protein UlaG (beta-lactamase superfamily)